MDAWDRACAILEHLKPAQTQGVRQILVDTLTLGLIESDSCKKAVTAAADMLLSTFRRNEAYIKTVAKICNTLVRKHRDMELETREDMIVSLMRTLAEYDTSGVSWKILKLASTDNCMLLNKLDSDTHVLEWAAKHAPYTSLLYLVRGPMRGIIDLPVLYTRLSRDKVTLESTTFGSELFSSAAVVNNVRINPKWATALKHAGLQATATTTTTPDNMDTDH